VLAVYAFAVFGYVTAAIATFFVGRDAEDERAEIVGVKDVAACEPKSQRCAPRSGRYVRRLTVPSAVNSARPRYPTSRSTDERSPKTVRPPLCRRLLRRMRSGATWAR